MNVPDAFCVAVTPAFANGIADPGIRAEALRSCVHTFGSGFQKGFARWVHGVPVHPDLRYAASELLAFDVYIHNIDRRFDNSNVLFRREELLVIDHDLAFEFIHPPAYFDPVLAPRIDDVVVRHPFGLPLKGKLPSLAGFRRELQSLTDAWFDDLRAATPPEWIAGPVSAHFDRIIAVLRDRRDHVDDWLTKVEAWME